MKNTAGKSNIQRVNIDLDRDLWREVGLYCLANDIQKRDFVMYALRKLLKNENAD